jgi:hypothetical protein
VKPVLKINQYYLQIRKIPNQLINQTKGSKVLCITKLLSLQKETQENREIRGLA